MCPLTGSLSGKGRKRESSLFGPLCFGHCTSGGAVKQVFSPRGTEKNLRRYIQRGLQRFFGQILVVYRRFRSVSFALWHSLKTVFPCAPCLSVAVYVVRKIVTTKETFRMDSEVLCSLLAFRLCISPFVPIDLHLLFWYCIVCKTPIKH